MLKIDRMKVLGSRLSPPRFLQQRGLNFQPACPAGEAVAEATGGSACRCRITHDTITTRDNPSALAYYCLSPLGYQGCPTWRTDKEATWAASSHDEVLNPADGD